MSDNEIVSSAADTVAQIWTAPTKITTSTKQNERYCQEQRDSNITFL